jgi:hypothetical protein
VGPSLVLAIVLVREERDTEGDAGVPLADGQPCEEPAHGTMCKQGQRPPWESALLT